MRWTIALITLALIAGLGWMTFREGGWLNQGTEERIEAALLAKGVSEPIASCMAERLTDRLTVGQLVKLKRITQREGESALPGNMDEAIERLQRVDDPEAVRIFILTATQCSVGNLL